MAKITMSHNGTDYEMPILKGENRKYVDDEVWFVEEE